MARGREAAAWGRESVLMSIMWSNFRAKFERAKAPKAMTPQDFNPYAEKEKPLIVPISALRDVFLKRKKK